MDWQTVTSALIVALCAGQAAWRLLPPTLRARWVARMRGLPAPAAPVGGGCDGCDGCGGGPAIQPRRSAGESVIRIVRR